MAEISGDAYKRLSIYLQDHFAGSTVGIELAKRTAKANLGTEFGDPLSRLAGEIDSDREELKRIMARVQVEPDRIKSGVAWAGERAGRLKPNGQLRGYSPLSRQLEVEGLISGVIGKLSLWRALRDLAPREARLGDAAHFDALVARAESQLDRLHALHSRAAALTFG